MPDNVRMAGDGIVQRLFNGVGWTTQGRPQITFMEPSSVSFLLTLCITDQSTDAKLDTKNKENGDEYYTSIIFIHKCRLRSKIFSENFPVYHPSTIPDHDPLMIYT